MALMQAIRNFSRLRQIVNILFKEGFGEVVDDLRFKSHLPIEKRMKTAKKGKKRRDSHAKRLRRAMEEAGGAFVKLGQMLSLRSDLIPQEYCEEFAKLQDQVKPIPYSAVKKVVEAELGKPIHRVFKTFDKTPIAAASVAQVHKAELKSGQTVAVKVQRPHIAKVFQSDIDILYYIAEQAEEHVEASRAFKPKKIVAEFEKYTRKELDFLQEAKNINLFFRKYKYSQYIKIPKVYKEFTSEKVLTMSFINGKKISEAKELNEKQKKRISMLVYKSFIEQVFRMHVFHADPHPGNVFIMDDGKISFLDFGIVGRVSPDTAEAVELMLVGLVKGNLDMLGDAFVNLGVLEADVDMSKFKQDLFESWAPYHDSTLDEINMGSFFADTFAMARKYNIEYPGNFVLLGKAVVTTEAFARKLWPQANFVKICGPMVEKILKEQNDPRKVIGNVKSGVFRWSRHLRKIPEDLRTLMYIFKKGATVKVDVNHKDLQNFTRELDKSSHHLVLSVIIGSLIVGAGLLTLAGAGPIFYGVSLLAWLAILVSLILSFGLMVSIVRERRRR
tara:strand:- start:6088 stop:7761 length:1674 start_codon:yes stop_codon:yes gene_type:complete